jgi:hypothetical protein
MVKKILFVAVLLLLVSVQAMTVSCDLRCSLMRASTGCHDMQIAEPMAHCHGMSMEQDKQANVSSSDSCAHSGCKTDLTAITKSADQNDAGPSKLLVSAVASLVGSFGSIERSRTAGFASSNRRENRPLAQRPGSSLRI